MRGAPRPTVLQIDRPGRALQALQLLGDVLAGLERERWQAEQELQEAWRRLDEALGEGEARRLRGARAASSVRIVRPPPMREV